MYMSALERPPDMASAISLLEFLLTLATFSSLALLPSASQGDKSTLTLAPELAWLSLTVRFLWNWMPPNQEWRMLGLDGEEATDPDANELFGLTAGELLELLLVGREESEEMVVAVFGEEEVRLGILVQELEMVLEGFWKFNFLLASNKAMVTSSILRTLQI